PADLDQQRIVTLRRQGLVDREQDRARIEHAPDRERPAGRRDERIDVVRSLADRLTEPELGQHRDQYLQDGEKDRSEARERRCGCHYRSTAGRAFRFLQAGIPIPRLRSPPAPGTLGETKQQGETGYGA